MPRFLFIASGNHVATMTLDRIGQPAHDPAHFLR